MIPHSITANSISILIDYRMRVIPSTSPNFKMIRDELRKKDPDIKKLKAWIDIPTFIAKVTVGRIRISADEVYFKNEKVNNYAATRLLAHLEAGDSIEPLAKMLDKLMDNPNASLRNDLWLWIEEGHLPICEDGDIVAFKKVGPDYESFQKDTDGTTYYHKVGSRVHMPRERCDENRNATCSRGLHFCSYGYLKEYDGHTGHVVVLKINPRDIVAIPNDHQNQKGRTCLYEVIGEVPREEAQEFFHGNVVSDVGTYHEPAHSEEPPDMSYEEPEEEPVDMGFAEPIEEPDDETVDTVTITISGKDIPKQALIDLVASIGQRGAAKQLKVARTTLQEALKRIRG